MEFILKSSTDIPVCGFKFHFPSQIHFKFSFHCLVVNPARGVFEAQKVFIR